MSIVEFTGGPTSVELPPAERKEMLTIGVDAATGKTRVKINSSSLSIIQECLRKAHYSLHEGWRSTAESPATLFGRAIHRALEVFYKGDPEERVLPKYEHLEMLAYGQQPPPTNNDLIYRAVAAFIETAQPLAGLPESDKRSIQNGVWILSEYFKKFIDDPYVAYVDSHGPFIERQFTLRFYEDASLIIDIFGTIDFAFQHVTTKEIILGDHKTASFLSYGDSSYYDRDKPNHQYTIYCMGAKRVFGIDTESFMVNVVEVKAKPKTKGARGVSFPRQITRRTEEDFAEVREVIMKGVQDYLYARANSVWPMGNVDVCNKFSGCSYKQVCASPKSTRKTILRNKFTKEGTNETK